MVFLWFSNPIPSHPQRGPQRGGRRTGHHRGDCSDSLRLDLPGHSCLLLLAPEKFAEAKVGGSGLQIGVEDIYIYNINIPI